jgi:hypothetical protein
MGEEKMVSSFLKFCIPVLMFANAAQSSVIVESAKTDIALDLSSESQNYRYKVIISRPVKPLKMTGNLFRDSYLRVSCGDTVIATDSQRITPSSFGKIMTFQVTFEMSNEICEDFNLQTVLETNGTLVDVPHLEYEIIKVRETVPFFISNVRAAMPASKQDIVYYHGEMSKALGNRVSLHCLIKDYEDDPNVSEIIDELLPQYKSLFGVEYVGPAIDCEVPPSLETEIKECSTKPNLRRNFCAFHKLYTQSLEFFSKSIASAHEHKSALSAGEAPFAADLDKSLW